MQYIDILKSIAIDNKYTKTYIKIVTGGVNYASSYTESHHILPKSFGLGGESDSNNLIQLTPKQHYICHLLLTKMFTGKYKSKMVYAFNGFIGTKNKSQYSRYTSRIYTYLKTKLKEDRNKYIRLYKNDSVKYIHEDDIETMKLYLLDGWVDKMTDEYKIGRVGNMKGKTHSTETKIKMSNSSPKVRPPLSDEHKQNIAHSLSGITRTDVTKKKMSDKLKEQYESGVRNSSGQNNPNYGNKKIINTTTNETKYVKSYELEYYLSNGWDLPKRRK